MSSGFGTNDKKDINELIKKIDLKINEIRKDFNKDVTLLKNQLNTCSTELNRLKELIQDVTDYTASEYEKLERKTAEFEAALDDIRSRLNTIQYNQVQGGKCASGINEFPIYARYAEKDINGADITATYTTKTELNTTSATLSGDYTQKIAESSSSGMSALSSVSAQLNNAINTESLRASNAEEALDIKIDDEITERRVECAELEDRIGAEEQARETAIGDLQTSLQKEETARELADDTLQTNLVAETTAREQADAELQNNLDDEISRTTAKETELDEKIDTNYELLDTALSAEVERANVAERDLYNYIDEVVENTNSAINDLENAIDTTSANLTDTINAETNRATNEENRLAGLLSQEIVDRTNAITDAKNELGTLIAEEETTRTSADASILSELHANYYTREEVDHAISEFGGFEVHASLEEITTPKTNVIYLIGPNGIEPDLYKEYIYYNGDFTLIGETTVDLSNYYNKTDINGFTALLNTSIETETTRATGVENNLDNKIDSVSSSITTQLDNVSGVLLDELNTSATNLSNTITSLSSTVDDTVDFLSANIPVLNQETDYLKVSLEQNGETIYGGMIGNHNINQENAGKILRINTEGTGLELVKNGLTYKEKYIPELGEQYVSVNCDYNTLTNLKVIPNETIDLTVNLPLQPKSDIVYHAIIQFTCDTGNKLANVILKYGSDYFNVCKFPTSYIDDLVYQIIIYNDCATIIPFGDDTIKKKDSDEQEWVLNEYSDLLHFFKDMGEEGEVHNGTPVDRPGFTNAIIKIDDEPKFGLCKDSAGFCNSIIKIEDEPKFGLCYSNAGFNNNIVKIDDEPKLGIYIENSNFGNEIIEIELIPENTEG